jgi:hypothetical protein
MTDNRRNIGCVDSSKWWVRPLRIGELSGAAHSAWVWQKTFIQTKVVTLADFMKVRLINPKIWRTIFTPNMDSVTRRVKLEKQVFRPSTHCRQGYLSVINWSGLDMAPNLASASGMVPAICLFIHVMGHGSHDFGLTGHF